MPLAVYAAVVPIIWLLIGRGTVFAICYAFNVHSPLHVDPSVPVVTGLRSSRQ